MRRVLMSMVVALAAVASPSAVVAVGATCQYSAADHKVTVTITGVTNPFVYRDVVNRITVNGTPCGAATVTSTDTIAVTGDSQAQDLKISLNPGGSFQPGFTNEAGTSDEIEFTVNLGGGSDTVTVIGTDAINRFVFGQDNGQAGFPRRINLNAGEGTGIDADVALSNVEKIVVYGQGGNDIIRARGTAGTGPNPFSLPMTVYGGGGADVIKGGEAQDRLYGDAGQDKVWGFGTGDFIHLNEGAPGDEGYGGAGVDLAYIDSGDSWQEN